MKPKKSTGVERCTKEQIQTLNLNLHQNHWCSPSAKSHEPLPAGRGFFLACHKQFAVIFVDKNRGAGVQGKQRKGNSPKEEQHERHRYRNF